MTPCDMVIMYPCGVDTYDRDVVDDAGDVACQPKRGFTTFVQKILWP
jgi:hypothetical protein